jgi:hypothetical protein
MNAAIMLKLPPKTKLETNRRTFIRLKLSDIAPHAFSLPLQHGPKCRAAQA